MTIKLVSAKTSTAISIAVTRLLQRKLVLQLEASIKEIKAKEAAIARMGLRGKSLSTEFEVGFKAVQDLRVEIETMGRIMTHYRDYLETLEGACEDYEDGGDGSLLIERKIERLKD